ncbi:hypothetical protein Golob_018122 [Gossypium lobatum]|uniref:Uncharacterized protein n=1 Tax=Gossypium lobatum TaxID=34289 RepID=A0A7J8M991_9ROSI|nr:hypothetical protein [Gossypium lobatum]
MLQTKLWLKKRPRNCLRPSKLT